MVRDGCCFLVLFIIYRNICVDGVRGSYRKEVEDVGREGFVSGVKSWFLEVG